MDMFEVNRESSTLGRPSGMVTFLFSDIEGSTLRWERDYEAMQEALLRHDALVRGALEAHGGYVFKTMGDAFCAAFERARDAAAAALEVQRGLGAQDFSAVDGVRVRIALHSGLADERNGDYFGPTVNRVARLLGIGHGGQVLVSGTTAELFEGATPDSWSLCDLGRHRLKDLARPEQVYQLLAPALAERFPPLRSLDVLPNNLPRQLTPFIGRDGVIAEIKALIAASPLVTLAGTGGAGKTRCAVQVAADFVDGSGDGVWFIDLAPLQNALMVPGTFAKILGVPESPQSPAVDSVVAFLRRRRLLLVVDNCEHVIDEVRATLAPILRECSEVRILATSRAALNIAGERVYRVPSLAVPGASLKLSASAAAVFPSVILFVDRAKAADARFALTDENAPSVAEICRRLDGIPLAVELAAARVNVLSPRALAHKLNESFRLLTGGDRAALPRQQTMRALIDWSHNLLSEAERRVFRRLSTFAGPFTLEIAGAVCRDETLDELVTFDSLASLVDKSLVHTEFAGDEHVYRLLESTRHYARDKLHIAGEEECTARSHALAYTLLAERLLNTPEPIADRTANAQIDPEIENLRAAVAWALIGRGDVDLGRRLVTALAYMGWTIPFAERLRWVEAARETIDEMTPSAAIAALDLADACMCAGARLYKRSLAAAQRAIERYVNLDDARNLAEARRTAGLSLIILGRIDEGEALLLGALGSRELFSGRRLGMMLQSLAYARRLAGDYIGARAYYRDAIATARNVGAEILAAGATLNLAETEFASGDASVAAELAAQALEIMRSFQSQEAVPASAGDLSAYLVALARFGEARAYAREALRVALDLGDRISALFAMHHLVAIAALQPPDSATADGDQSARNRRIAAQLLGYVDAQLEALETQRQYTEQSEYDKLRPALEGELDAGQLAQLRNEGRNWAEELAVEQAFFL